MALLIWAAVSGWHGTRVAKVKSIEPRDPWLETTFRSGASFADDREIPAGLQTRGSRIDGRLEYMGTFLSGWFRAEPSVTLLVAGFPTMPGNLLALDVRTAKGEDTLLFNEVAPRDCWRPWRVALPHDAVSFRVRATDGTKGENGWLAVTEPFKSGFRPDLLSQIPRTFLAFLINGILFTVVGFAVFNAAPAFFARLKSPPLLILLIAAAVALLGYLAFWIYFAHPLAGRVFSWTLLFASIGALLFPVANRKGKARHVWHSLFLAGVIGIFYLALLMLFEPSRFSYVAANRFDSGLPPDNEIPRVFSERLWNGESPRQFFGDWLSSDRPPLQVGWQLITWPVLHGLHFDVDTITSVSGVLFQLLWVPAVCAMAMTFGASHRQSLGIAAAIGCCGVLLEFTVFVWPKLGAAALVTGAYLMWFDGSSAPSRMRFAIGGVLAALGWLAHGGVAFSIIAFAPLAWAARRSIPVSHWMVAAAAFLLCAIPWVAYQHWYDPPGNRLLKWHLAGVIDIDSRGFLETLRDSYGVAGQAAWMHKWSNLRMQLRGNWQELWRWDFSSGWLFLRASETTYTVRALGWWVLAAIVPLIMVFRKNHGSLPKQTAEITRSLYWLLFGLIVWLLLMFIPDSATVHQGSLVTELLAMTLLAVGALHVSRWFFGVLALVQVVWFLAAWIPPSRMVEGDFAWSSATMMGIAGTVLVLVVARSLRGESPDELRTITSTDANNGSRLLPTER